jgi:hypothetical protein
MKLHQTVVQELVKIYEIYGGHREDVKLRQMLCEVDLSVYKQKSPPYDELVVLTRDTKR